MMKAVILAGILAAASICAQASDFYVLGNIGQSNFKLNEADSESTTIFDFGMGYSFNENLSVEMAYRDLGTISGYDDFNFDLDVTALQLSAVVTIPVGESFFAFGRWGAGRVEVDPGTFKTTKALYSLGMGYKLIDPLSLRVEYLQYAKFENVTVSTIAAGATYRF